MDGDMMRAIVKAYREFAKPNLPEDARGDTPVQILVNFKLRHLRSLERTMDEIVMLSQVWKWFWCPLGGHVWARLRYDDEHRRCLRCGTERGQRKRREPTLSNPLIEKPKAIVARSNS